jgi:hypothetical protein
MSYLNTPHLVFTGDFMADTSTVNNDVRHYDNDSFQQNFQKPGKGALDGWWNPTGGSVFDFRNCSVRQISFPDGSQQTAGTGTDAVLGQLVGGPEGRATGKMVDMDPQWQMSSELWGVRLRIYTAKNELLLSGELAVSGFRDLQSRQQNGTKVNGQPMGGGWTTVLENIVWGDAAAGSPFLVALRNTTQNNTLSLQLNMYGFYYNHNDGRFGMGRIIGTIGPWFANEPKTFAPNRRLYGVLDWGGGNIFLNYANFLVDAPNASVTVDLGGSFPIQDSMGTISGNTQYILGVLNGSSDFVPSADAGTSYLQASDFVVLGNVNYTSGDNSWLNTTGGIVTLTNLTAAQLAQLANHQLVIVTPSQTNPGQFVLVCREAIDGINVRADNLNVRLDYGQHVSVYLYAYQWGAPIPGLNNITFSIQPPTQAFFGGQMVGPNKPTAPIPYINTPIDVLKFPVSIPVAANALAAWVVGPSIKTLGKPRGYIDGQMYYITYLLNAQQPDPAWYGMDYIYINLRSYYEVPENPTWDDISPILTQFGNVYPLMSKYIVDLSSPEAVLAKKDILIYSFTRDINDPVYMPATRDMSEAVRQTIVKWLLNPLPGKGTVAKVAAAVAPQAPTEDTELQESDEIKKVRKLTELKNGATNEEAPMPSPFENL